MISIYPSKGLLHAFLWVSSLMACLCPRRRTLLLRYGSAVDAAVSNALKPEEASAPAGTSAKLQSVAQFAQAALGSHSAHSLLAGSSTTTIANAVDAPSAELRRMVSNLLCDHRRGSDFHGILHKYFFFRHRLPMEDARDALDTGICVGAFIA